MSNRITAFLILLFFFGGILAIYEYFFVMNTGTLHVRIEGDATGVTVQLTGEFQNTYTRECTEVCTFADIPPLAYRMRISKDGYDTTERSLSIMNRKSTDITVSLERTIVITPISFSGILTTDASGAILLTVYSLPYRIFSDSMTIEALPHDSVKKSRLLYRAGTNDILRDTAVNPYSGFVTFRQNGNANVYDISDAMLTTLPLSPDVHVTTVRRTSEDRIWLVTTDRGTYRYDREAHTVSLHPLYDDYILLDSDHIVGIVRPSSIVRRRLLDMDTSSDTAIILENITTKTRSIVATTSLDSMYMETRAGQTLLIGRNGQAYAVRYLRDRRGK